MMKKLLFLMTIVLLLGYSYSKGEKPNPISTKVIPTVSTTVTTSITQNNATSGGNITSDGGAAVTVRGVCWSTNNNPTTSDNKTSDGSGMGGFSSSVTGLIPNTTYYIRAYATNSIGSAYGNQLSFTTSAIIPTLTTTAITDIGATSATSGGNITSDGGSAVTARGVCWDLNQTPTIANSKTIESSGLSVFTTSIVGLNPSTTYYVRAYATNSVGTGYGNAISVTSLGIIFNPDLTYGSVTDIDGNVYKTILIGSQTWMAENLKTTKYRNGNLIGTTTYATLDISNATTYPTPKYQWAYAGNESNVATYGRLYTWYAATDSLNVCPTGWHLPTDTEWKILTNHLGGESAAGGKLKETGTTHWLSPNTGATNTSGFTALPGGYRNVDGAFTSIGYTGYWWSSTEYPAYGAWRRYMTYDSSNVSGYLNLEAYGFSVRCVKD